MYITIRTVFNEWATIQVNYNFFRFLENVK